MDKQEFKEWFKVFNAKYKGVCPPDSWFDTVVEKHKKLQKLLGSHTKEVELKLDSYQNPAKYYEIEPEVTELVTKIPRWFIDNKIRPEDLCHPVITRGDHEGMKWGRNIEFWRKKNAPTVNKDDISKIMGRLGEKWAKCKTEKQKLYATMSVHPAAFVALGHYAPDISLITGKPSCWQQGACSQTEKYKVAVYPNSFVLLVGINPFDTSWNNLDVESRVWGIPDASFSTFHLSNFYHKANIDKKGKAISIGNVHHAWKSFFQNLLEGPVDQLEKKFTFTGAFQNKQGSISFFQKGQACSPLRIEFSYGMIDEVQPCRFCRRYVGDAQVIEGNTVCEGCLDRVPVCVWTNERTFSVINAYLPDKRLAYIKSSLVNRRDPDCEWVYCELSGNYSHKSLMRKMTAFAGGHKACLPELEKHRYKECKGCGLYEVTDDPYGANKPKLCYQCCIEEAKKKAIEDELVNSPNSRTTYVKLKSFTRDKHNEPRY